MTILLSVLSSWPLEALVLSPNEDESFLCCLSVSLMVPSVSQPPRAVLPEELWDSNHIAATSF